MLRRLLGGAAQHQALRIRQPIIGWYFAMRTFGKALLAFNACCYLYALMRILVRLPNWLGDLVMSTAMIRGLRQLHPHAQLQLVVKQELAALVPYLADVNTCHVFSKNEWPGTKGAYRYGKMLAKQVGAIDIFYCVPDSFSSAAMALGTGARQRVGFKNELRGWMLTQSYYKPKGLHRVEEYLWLLERHQGRKVPDAMVGLKRPTQPIAGRLIVNVNSEAESRRLPVPKAIEIVKGLAGIPLKELVFIGSKKEVPHVQAVIEGLGSLPGILNMAGKTDFPGLIELLSTGIAMLTTDSGPMHLANALGVHTIALEGASDERNTAPYNHQKRTLIRYGQLPCEPCVKNVCKYGVPKCLMGMHSAIIAAAVHKAMLVG